MLELSKKSEEQQQSQLQALEQELGRQRRQVAAAAQAREAADCRLRQQDSRIAALLAERDSLRAEAGEQRRRLEVLPTHAPRIYLKNHHNSPQENKNENYFV